MRNNKGWSLFVLRLGWVCGSLLRKVEVLDPFCWVQRLFLLFLLVIVDYAKWTFCLSQPPIFLDYEVELFLQHQNLRRDMFEHGHFRPQKAHFLDLRMHLSVLCAQELILFEYLLTLKPKLVNFCPEVGQPLLLLTSLFGWGWFEVVCWAERGGRDRAIQEVSHCLPLIRLLTLPMLLGLLLRFIQVGKQVDQRSEFVPDSDKVLMLTLLVHFLA